MTATLDDHTSVFGETFIEAMNQPPNLLGVDDIRAVLPALDPERRQPRYAFWDWEKRAKISTCSYAERVRGNPTTVPSCIVGHIIKELAPGFFNQIAGSTHFVRQLPGIERVFTPEAIAALTQAQMSADAQCTWGEAIADAGL